MSKEATLSLSITLCPSSHLLTHAAMAFNACKE